MKVETKHLETREAQLTVELDAERVEKAMKAAGKRLSRKVRIPGFRKGKAPYWRIVQAFGEAAILEEALEDLGQKIYEEALDEGQIEPYGPGILENVETDPVVLTFRVPLQPIVDLGAYREVRVPYEVPEVTDEEVNEAMQNLRERRALVEEIDRPADWGDRVTLDVFGALVPEGQEELDEDEEIPDADVLIDEGVFEFDINAERDLLPGFAAELVGLTVGDEKEFMLDIPDDYDIENLRGRRAFFELACTQVSSRTLPALSDTFAADVTDGEHETLLELRIEVRKQLQQIAEHEAESPYLDEVLDKTLEGTTLAYPPMMVDDVVERELERLDGNLRHNGLTLDDYLRIKQQTREQLAEEFREPAEQRLRRGLVLGEIARVEELEFSDGDLDAELKDLLGDKADTLDEEARASYRNRLLTRRCIERLVAIGKGEDPSKGPSPKSRLRRKVTSEHVATLDDLRDEVKAARDAEDEEDEILFPGQRVEGGIVRID